MPEEENKALQIDPTAHPGAMVALCLTPEQQEALRAAAGLPAAEADHVTLAYLAPDAAALADRKNDLVQALAALARCTPPLTGTIGGIARFNASESSDGQDVCVALYDSPALPALYGAICACVCACGIDLTSDHGFTPHVTLGYLEEGSALPVEQLPRTPLDFPFLTLIWGGERIDLPFQGGQEPQPATLAYGGEAKALSDDPYRIRTRGIVWGGYDLYGDQFVRGETDLGASRSFVGMPVFWDHADFHSKNPIKSQIGTVVYADEDDKGITFDIELDRSKAYVKDVLALERAGVLGSSTGAIDYLVKRRQGKLKRWIIGEISLTPEPVEPRTHAAFAGKSLSEEDAAMGDTQAQDTPAGADVAQLVTQVKALETGLAERDAKIAGLEAALSGKADAGEVKTLGTSVLEHIASIKSVRTDLDEIRSMPAVKNAKSRDPHEAAQELGGAYGGGLSARAGEGRYHNMKALFLPGGRAKMAERYPEGIFGGYIKAVLDARTSLDRSADARKALREIYGVDENDPAAKALGTMAGTSGAYLIAEQFIPTLMQVAQQKNALYGRAMVIPADGGEIVIPALDHSGTYVEGQSQYYGGVTISWGDDDAAPPLTQPGFKQIRLKTTALKARVRIKNSLLQRSAITIDSVVTALLGGAVGWARDYAMIRGTGVGQPQGALNAPACIDSGGTTLDYATLVSMENRTIPERDDNYIWLIHTLRRGDVMALQQTNNTLVTFLPDLRGKPGTILMGREVVYTDKLPYTSGASNAADSVLLVDPTMIVAAEYQGIALAVSDQVRFEDDETVFRVILSMDSQPWLTTPIAIGAGASDTISGYIKL
jgi:HK97 family phage major capsid protein